MTIYPAIDMLDGQTVRLRQGDPRRRVVVAADPVAAAARWEADGAAWLHVVDLDGALTGAPRHLDVVAAICGRVRIPVQLGGGLRTMADVDAAFQTGASRIILGTAALTGHLLEEAVRGYGDRIAVALDTRDGRVVMNGWQTASPVRVLEAAALLVERGARRLIHTDVRRDGMLAGPDVAGLAALIGQVTVPVIASGGIRSAADLRALAGAGAEGAIIGRALYDGRLTLRGALSAGVEVG